MTSTNPVSRDNKLVPDTPGWQAMGHLVEARQAMLSDDSMTVRDYIGVMRQMNSVIDRLSAILLPNVTDDMFPEAEVAPATEEVTQ